MTGRRYLAVCGGFCLLVSAGAHRPGEAPQNPWEASAPPETAAEADRLRDAVLGEIEQLREEGRELPAEPGTEPDKFLAQVRAELLEALSTYAGLLADHAAALKERDEVRSAEGLARQSEKLLELQRRIEDIRAQREAPPTSVTEAEVAAAEALWGEANDALIHEAVARSERAQQIAELTAQREQTAAQVERSQAALTEEASRGSSGGGSATEVLAGRLRLRALQIAASAALLRQANAEALIEISEGALEDAEQRLPLLREVASLLDERCENLKRIQARNERQQIIDWVDFVYSYPGRASAAERAYWPMRLAISDAQLEIRRLRDESGIVERYTEDKHADLASDLAVQQAVWSQFVSSLKRRPGEQIQQRYREILQQIRKWHGRRDQIRALHDTTFDDQARIEYRLSELDEAIRAQLRETRAVLDTAPQDRQGIERRKQLSDHKQALDEEARALAQELKQLIDRLSEAGQMLASHIAGLEAVRGRMYWSFLSIAEVPLWKYRWSRSAEEWNEPARRQKRAQDVAALGEGWSRVTPPAWATLGVVLVVCLAAGGWLRGQAARAAARREAALVARLRSGDLPPVTLSERIDLHALRLVARTAPVVLPGIGAWAWLRMSPANSPLAAMIIAFVCGTVIAFALVRFAFAAGDPRLRLLPCTDAVASYYRRWTCGLLVFSLLAVPVPLFLSTVEWAYYTRAYLWSLYTLVMLAATFVFLIRREKVLGVVSGPGAGRPALVWMAVSAFYPAVQLLVLVLLATQVIGYGELNRYVVAGVSATLGTLAGAGLLIRYVVEVLAKLQDTLRKAAAESEARRRQEDAERAAALSAGREVAMAAPAAPEESGVPVGVAASLLRVAVWTGAAAIVLQCWGFSWGDLRGWMNLALVPADGDRPAITIGRALLAVAIVLVSWLVSRSMRTILDTKVYPTYGQLDRGGRVAVNTALHYMLLLLGVYFGMYMLRIPLGAVTVVLGTVGLGLGLALQPLFINFLSGLIMLFERHVKVGDIVEVDGNLGEVTNISIRATTIKTFDNVDLVIPNGEFVASKVVNWTLKDERVRGKLPVGVAYGSDPRLVERLLIQVATESPLVLRDPAPRVRFLDFGDSSLQFALYAWFRNVSDRWDFVTDARYRVFELLQQNGIEIPFPQREFSFREDQPLRVEVLGPAGAAPREPGAVPAARFVRKLPAADREGT